FCGIGAFIFLGHIHVGRPNDLAAGGMAGKAVAFLHQIFAFVSAHESCRQEGHKTEGSNGQTGFQCHGVPKKLVNFSTKSDYHKLYALSLSRFQEAKNHPLDSFFRALDVAASVAVITASSWAALMKPASKAEGAR